MQLMDQHLEEGMIYIFEITLIQLMVVIQMQTILIKSTIYKSMELPRHFMLIHTILQLRIFKYLE